MSRSIIVVIATIVAAAVLASTATPASAAGFPPTPFSSKIAYKTCIPRKDLSKSLKAQLKAVVGSTCLPKIKFKVNADPGRAVAAYTLGQLWCITLHTSPGRFSALSFANAGRFCGKQGRGWSFVKWH